MKKIVFLYHDRVIRIFIGFLSLLFLSLFFHFREMRVEPFELNTIAGKYIVSQIDFSFPDEETTVILKQEAVRNVGQIFRFGEKELQLAKKQFEDFLIQDTWKNELPNATYEELDLIAKSFKELLAKLFFTDLRTYQKIKELNLSTKYVFVLSPPKEEVQTLSLPKAYWNSIQKTLFEEELIKKIKTNDTGSMNFVMNFYENRPLPLVRFLEKETELRDLLQKNVLTAYTHVKAGTKIIEKEERVTQRHIAMIHAMREALNEQKNLDPLKKIIGEVLLALSFLFVAYLYLKKEQKNLLTLQKLSLIVCIGIITLVFAKLVEVFLVNNVSYTIESIRYPLLVPFAAILFTILTNHRAALFFTAFFAVILSVTLVFDPTRFLIVNIIASFVVIFTTGSLRKRKDIFQICAIGLLAALPVILVYHLLSLKQPTLWMNIVSAAVFMIVTAVLVIGSLPLLESMFNVMTDITLMEYMDPNNELLRQLTLEIPGTYQHSLVLGNIAETAARSIDANGLLCRVATLYHDIGKLSNPTYFTENQQIAVNVHQILTPAESAQVIISHVKDGEILAKKYHLPEAFIDIIKEHHGTTLVYFFYHKELELKGGKKELVDESLFRYPGPKPHSKESAIIMLADAAEAAMRSEEDLSEERLYELMDSLTKDRIEDGQFDECPLTFEEMFLVKKNIVKTILSMHHIRVKYPEKT